MNYSSLSPELSLSWLKQHRWICPSRLLHQSLSESSNNNNTHFLLNEKLIYYLSSCTSMKSSYSSCTLKSAYWLFTSNKSVKVFTKLCLSCRLDFFFSALRCPITHEPTRHKCSFCIPPTQHILITSYTAFLFIF